MLLEQQADSGIADPFPGLVANFYSLKSKKIPVGRVAFAHWLGCYRVGNRVGIFT